MRYRKTVTEPRTRAAPRLGLRGLVDDFGSRTEDVVLTAGELHDTRPPVSRLETISIPVH